jgi:hypothetical protein
MKNKEGNKKDNKPEKIRQFLRAFNSIIGFIGAFLFLSPNITGNAIGNLTVSNLNLIALLFLVAGTANAFFYFRTKHRLNKA